MPSRTTATSTARCTFLMRRSRRGSNRSSVANSTSVRRKTIAPTRAATTTTTCWCWPENEEGYRNLVRITSEAALHGFYRKPRISKNFLAKHSAGFDRLLRLPGRRAFTEPDEGQLRGGETDGRPVPGHFRQGAIFFSRSRTRGWNWRRRSMRTCSSWKGNWASRWSPPMTATTCAKTTITRMKCCSACRQRIRSIMTSASSSIPTSSM